MSKVTFEFDEDKNRSDINVIVNRYKLISALEDLDTLYRNLYNGKIYDPDNIVYITKDSRIATEEDYKEAQDRGKPLSGLGYYIKQDWIENKLDDILQNVRQTLNDYLY